MTDTEIIIEVAKDCGFAVQPEYDVIELGLDATFSLSSPSAHKLLMLEVLKKEGWGIHYGEGVAHIQKEFVYSEVFYIKTNIPVSDLPITVIKARHEKMKEGDNV